jgi:hypothetical protein
MRMRGLIDLPPSLRRVIADYIKVREQAAEDRGFARGKVAAAEEMASGLRVLSNLVQIPQVQALPPVLAPVPGPTVVLSEDGMDGGGDDGGDSDSDVMMGLETTAGPESLADVMDRLFGDAQWSDLDRRELIRFVMASVTEAMKSRGQDPSAVLEVLMGMEQDPEGFDAAMDGQADQWMGWQASPLRNPRGQFRFVATDSRTGNKLYGQKAIDVMRRKNRDKFQFMPGHQKMPFESDDEQTLMDHTEAYRKARESLADLRARLAQGDQPSPGDLMDYMNYLPLLTAQELRGLRGILSQSLTKRIRVGRTKSDRVAGISEALGRLRTAAEQITQAVLEYQGESPEEAEEDADMMIADIELDPAELGLGGD